MLKLANGVVLVEVDRVLTGDVELVISAVAVATLSGIVLVVASVA